MRHKAFDTTLETRSDFDVTVDTHTWLNWNDKLLFGPNSARDIARIVPTQANYVWSDGLFKADYTPDKIVKITGIGVLDEWREIPSRVPFNVYGFDYCPAEEEYIFRATTLEAGEQEADSLVFDMNIKERAMLARFTLTKAMIDLASS